MKWIDNSISNYFLIYLQRPSVPKYALAENRSSKILLGTREILGQADSYAPTKKCSLFEKFYLPFWK